AHFGFPRDEAAFIRLRAVVSGKELRRLPVHSFGNFNVLEFSPDSRTLIGGGRHYNDLVLWEVATGQMRGKFSGHQGRPGPTAFSLNGRLLASGSSDGTVLIWDVAGQRDRQKPPLPLKGDQLEKLWTDLAGPDAVVGYQA